MNRRAQSTMEYLILFSIIIAALITTQVYLKRGMQGRLRGYAEQLNEGLTYSPQATDSIQTITRNVDEFSSSNTTNRICRAEDGSLKDCNDTGVSQGKLTKLRITDSQVTIEQLTERLEATLPLKDEPRRK